MSELRTIQGTRWAGQKELWLDPLGNEATVSPCTIHIDGDVVLYTWTYEAKPQEGRISLAADGASFTDTWHQPTPMRCRTVAGNGGFFLVQGSYGPDADWGWRIGLALRPSGELVLQMTNVTPWGEEGRAVRLTCRQEG